MSFGTEIEFKIGGSGLMPDDKTSLEERECTGCHEVVLTFERSYDHESAVEIVTQWYSEAGADWSIVPVCESGRWLGECADSA